MSMRKDDQKDCTHFRSERFSMVNGAWYFQTRENTLGPFSDRQLAEDALQNYLVELVALKSFEESRQLARIIRVADSEEQAQRHSSEPLIEVVEEYRLERRTEQRTPVLEGLSSRPKGSTQAFTSSGSRLTLVPIER